MKMTVTYEFSGMFNSEEVLKGQKQGFEGCEFSGSFTYEPTDYDQLDPYHNWGQSIVTVAVRDTTYSLTGEGANILLKGDQLDQLEFSDYNNVSFPMGTTKEWQLVLTLADNVIPTNPIPLDQITEAYFYFHDIHEALSPTQKSWDVTASGPVPVGTPPSPPNGLHIS